MNWDGSERRNQDREDHDVLTRIDVNLSNFMSRFSEHVDQDEINFQEIRESIENIKRYVYIGIGGVLVIQFVFQFLK